MKKCDLILLLPQHKEDGVKEVDKLGDHVEVVESDDLHVPVGALVQWRKGGVEHARESLGVVDDQSNEDVGVEGGHGDVVVEKGPLEGKRLSVAHQPGPDDADKGDVGNQNGQRQAETAHEEVALVKARVAVFPPKALHHPVLH